MKFIAIITSLTINLAMAQNGVYECYVNSSASEYSFLFDLERYTQGKGYVEIYNNENFVLGYAVDIERNDGILKIIESQNQNHKFEIDTNGDEINGHAELPATFGKLPFSYCKLHLI